jgi:hypothetical protein
LIKIADSETPQRNIFVQYGFDIAVDYEKVAIYPNAGIIGGHIHLYEPPFTIECICVCDRIMNVVMRNVVTGISSGTGCFQGPNITFPEAGAALPFCIK